MDSSLYEEDDLMMIDEDSSSFASSNTASVATRSLAARRASGTTEAGRTAGNSVKASVIPSRNPTTITGTLNIIPNIGDTSDAESIIDNNHPRISSRTADDEDMTHFIPNMSHDDVFMNNMDTSSSTKLTDENKYLIPNIPDLFETNKLNKANIELLPKGKPQAPSAPMSRSESISSLTSEASLPAEAATWRTGVSPTETGSRASTKHRSSRRRRSSLKPHIKSKFADLTLQYIRDRLTGQA